jgi:hypothetical protein
MRMYHSPSTSLPEFVDADDVRVTQPRGDPRLVEKAPQDVPVWNHR